MLSHKDICKELGKKILIYPFNEKSIKGASINLTASKFAWNALKEKETAYSEEHNEITILSQSTILVETEECISVSTKIGGTYHPRVKQVSRGIGHVATTLDPGWIGPSLIALHNHTTEPIKIKPGDGILSICFHYLKSKSDFTTSSNAPGRTELLTDLQDTREVFDWLDENYKKDPKLLKEKMVNSEEYKKFRTEELIRSGWKGFISWTNIIKIVSSLIILSVIGLILYDKFDSVKLMEDNFTNTFFAGAIGTVIGVMITFIGKLLIIKKRR